jgi:hypothetical protein
MDSCLSGKITKPNNELGISPSSPCYSNGYFVLLKTLAAYYQLFNIQFHQMLKIGIQFFFGKIGEKFRLCAAVNLTYTIDDFPFTHSDILQKIKAAPRPMQYRPAELFFFNPSAARKTNAL